MNGAGGQAPIEVLVNGQSRVLATATSVSALLDQLGLDERAVAVEMDGSIVPRGARGTTPIGDGARLEIVRFVQGG